MCQYDMCVCCEALDLKQAFQLMVFFISELHFIMRVEYWLLCVCERVCDVAICTFDECVFVSQSHYHLFHIKLNLSSRLVIIIIVYTVCVCVFAQWPLSFLLLLLLLQCVFSSFSIFLLHWLLYPFCMFWWERQRRRERKQQQELYPFKICRNSIALLSNSEWWNSCCYLFTFTPWTIYAIISRPAQHMHQHKMKNFFSLDNCSERGRENVNVIHFEWWAFELSYAVVGIFFHILFSIHIKSQVKGKFV